MRNGLLVRVSIWKSIALLRRYAFNTIAMFVGLYLLFTLVFFGGLAVAPTQTENAADELVTGYFLWIMATSAYQSTASDIMKESQWGTLEQLYMSPYGLYRILVVQTVVNVARSVIQSSLVLVLIMFTTTTWLRFDVVTALPLSILTIAPAIGIGLALGGLALVFKRIGQVTSLLQLLFVALLAVPLEASPLVKFLPLSLGNDMLNRAVSQDVPLWAFDPGRLLLLAGIAVLYTGAGFAVFGKLQAVARRRGVMGHY